MYATPPAPRASSNGFVRPRRRPRCSCWRATSAVQAYYSKRKRSSSATSRRSFTRFTYGEGYAVATSWSPSSVARIRLRGGMNSRIHLDTQQERVPFRDTGFHSFGPKAMAELRPSRSASSLRHGRSRAWPPLPAREAILKARIEGLALLTLRSVCPHSEAIGLEDTAPDSVFRISIMSADVLRSISWI